MRRFIKYLFPPALAFILTTIWFWGISSNEFLYLHDEFLPLSKDEVLKSFFVRNPINLGSSSVVDTLIVFFDKIFYLVMHSLNINLLTIQFVFYFLKLLFLISIPMVGFKKLAELYKVTIDRTSICLISIWYSFNTFTLIYWHSQAFSLTVMTAYALAPLALYHYHLSVFGKSKLEKKIVTCILIFLMSFSVTLFAVFVLILIAYTLLYWYFTKKNIFNSIQNIVKIGIIYIPFSAVFLFIPYDIYLNTARAVNFTGNEAYGNLHGGLLSPLLMWFSWAIYNTWEPRSIFTFYKYFTSPYMLIAPFILYGIIIYGFLKNKTDKYSKIFFSIFLFFLFFIKGPQNPFGAFYLFLIEHFFVFSIFRSPDTKLGFGIVFLIALMLMFAIKIYPKRVFNSILVIVILIQSFPLLSGVGIKGENSSTSSDRIIAISDEYKQVSDFLNKNSNSYDYIFPLPSDQFTYYKLNKSEKHLGQDLLSKLVHNPFIYFTETGGMSNVAYMKIESMIKSNTFLNTTEMPIRYFLIRKDILDNSSNNEYRLKFSKEAKLVFENSLFSIYENPNSIPILQSDNAIFQTVNPVHYKLYFKNVKRDASLIFNQSFSNNWKLYVPPADSEERDCDKNQLSSTLCIFRTEEIGYFWNKPDFESTHSIENGYANKWSISPEYIKRNFDKDRYTLNQDGTINFKLVLYYKPQSLFYNGVIISFSYMFFLLGILVFIVNKNK